MPVVVPTLAVNLDPEPKEANVAVSHAYSVSLETKLRAGVIVIGLYAYSDIGVITYTCCRF